MPQSVAALLCAFGILALFLLEHDHKARTSRALWIPVVWILILGSREPSRWVAEFGSVGFPDVVSAEAYLEGNALDRNVYACLVVLGIITLIRRGPHAWSLLRANPQIVLFFGYCALSICWSDYPQIALKRWIKAVGDLVMGMIILTDPARPAAINRVFARTGFLLIPLSLLFVKYYPTLGRQFKTDGSPVNIGIATNKNILGVLCLTFGLASAWRLLDSCQGRRITQRVRSVVVHGTVLAMVFRLFVMADSMTSLACFFLASAVMVASRTRTVARAPQTVHFLMVATASIAFASLFLDVGATSLHALGRDSSLTGRTGLWNLLLRMQDSPWLGSGFESFWLGERLRAIWGLYWWHPNEAHNGYLEIYLNLGAIGLTLLAILIMTGYHHLLAAYRADPGGASLKMAFFLVAVIYSFTEAGFRMMGLVWFTFLLSIMAIPKASPYRNGAAARINQFERTARKSWAESHTPERALSRTFHS